MQDVYDMTKAIVEGYDLYKGAAPVMSEYDVNKAAHPPYDTPCHDGAKKYFEEIGVWTEADETWNTNRLARLAKVQEAWTAATEAADDKGVADKDWPAYWDQFRSDHL